MDGNQAYITTLNNESKDRYFDVLVMPKQITSKTSSLFRQTKNQQQPSLNQINISTDDTGHQSRKKTTLYPNWFRKRKVKKKNGHDLENTLGTFVEVGLATVMGNSVHDIYEVVCCSFKYL